MGLPSSVELGLALRDVEDDDYKHMVAITVGDNVFNCSNYPPEMNDEDEE